MTTAGTSYDHAAHNQLFEQLQALEPDGRWIDVDPKLFMVATPSSPLRITALIGHSSQPVLSLTRNLCIGVEVSRSDTALEAVKLLSDLRADIEEEIFAGVEPNFGSGAPQKASVNVRSVQIRMGSAIDIGRRTITAQVGYAVLAQQPRYGE